jgi:hypothetical protein
MFPRRLLSDEVSFNLLKPTGYGMHQPNMLTTVRSAHTVFMCLVFV